MYVATIRSEVCPHGKMATDHKKPVTVLVVVEPSSSDASKVEFDSFKNGSLSGKIQCVQHVNSYAQVALAFVVAGFLQVPQGTTMAAVRSRVAVELQDIPLDFDYIDVTDNFRRIPREQVGNFRNSASF